ncbi:MAG: universal stress protein [Planctomycetes bacterium]|nr:universal stress protein [Planctomycetota bacterium]MBM4081227.1 universal stress protein [Planctomycetota bacterium]
MSESTRNGSQSRNAGGGGASPGGWAMLALSTFRQSEKAVALALEKGAQCGGLVIVNVADVNLARYVIGSELELLPGLQDKCEEDLLKEHAQRAQAQVEALAAQAKARGIPVKTHAQIGRFGLVCMEVIRQEKPSVVITTRTRRPRWVKRLFGSPVDYLVAHAGCPVVEA